MTALHFPTAPLIARLLYPKGLYWNMKGIGSETNIKRIYLTFDDGPVPEVTPQVLDILKEFKAKATFFCVGDNVRKYPEVYERIIINGHATGNHTYSHLNGFKTEGLTYLGDVEKCNLLIKSKLFRPPFGRITNSQATELQKNYSIIMWSVLSGDYNKKIPKEKVLKYTLRNSTDGSIIVFHDSIKASERMIYALPRTLEHFSRLGYSFNAIHL